MSPSAAYTSLDVPISISGEHFEPLAVQRVGGGGGVDVDSSFRAFVGSVKLENVRWEAPDRLSAVVPAGVSGGPYDVRVVGPTGEGTVPAAFTGSTANPAQLTATVSAPGRIEVGTQAEVDLLVTDVGQSAVASPAVVLLSTPEIAVVAVPGPGMLRIDPGQTVHLVALVSAEIRGSAQLTLQATGVDAFDGSTVQATTSTTVPVVAPATLTVATIPVPDLVSVGQSLDLVATVANQGDVDALGVAVGNLTITGPGGAAIDAIPPAQDIPAGASRTFHVAAHATSPGAVFFGTSVSASDAITGGPVSVQASWDIVFVQAAAQLSARWLTVPQMTSPGRTFTATFGVTNTGEALARDVVPLPNPPAVVALSGSAGLSTSQAPLPVDVPGGSTAVFSWTFAVSGTAPASLQLSAGGSGTESNAGTALSAPSATSSAISVQTPSGLSATLTAASAALRGDTFLVTLAVTDSGGIGVNSLTPSLAFAGTGAAQIVSGPTPASQNVAGGGTTSFTWTCSAIANGAVALSAQVSGTDAVDGTARSATAGSTVAISDAVQLANSPLGSATAFAYVFGFNGRLYLGPGSDGTGGIRMQPDGTVPEAFTLGFLADSVNGNDNQPSNGRFPSLGFTGCARDTLQCGPDNENGRGLFGSGTVGGTPWLFAIGARTSSVISHLYGTTDTGTAPSFSYDYLGNVVSSQSRGASSMLVFRDRLYVGFVDTGATRPTYIVLRKMPAAPGSTPVIGVDVQNLRINDVTGVGSSALVNRNTALTQLIDSQVAFNDLVYVANNGGIVHSNTSDPQPPLLGLAPDWSKSTPSAAQYSANSSITTRKTMDLEPADKAFPQMVALGGKLYAARNTTAGPQLWVCTPGADLACDPQDWSLLARNDVGDTTLSQFDDPQNVRVTLLAATSARLYVGYNNSAGVVIYRSQGISPSVRADFEGAASCNASAAPSSCDGLGGRGLGAGATRIFDGRVFTSAGKDYVYLTAGNGSTGFRVFRLVQ